MLLSLGRFPAWGEGGSDDENTALGGKFDSNHNQEFQSTTNAILKAPILKSKTRTPSSPSKGNLKVLFF